MRFVLIFYLSIIIKLGCVFPSLFLNRLRFSSNFQS